MEAVGERWVERGTWTDLDACMTEPLAAATQGPLGVGRCWEQRELSARVMKWSVAPESATAERDGDDEGGSTFLDNNADA